MNFQRAPRFQYKSDSWHDPYRPIGWGADELLAVGDCGAVLDEPTLRKVSA